MKRSDFLIASVRAWPERLGEPPVALFEVQADAMGLTEDAVPRAPSPSSAGYRDPGDRRPSRPPPAPRPLPGVRPLSRDFAEALDLERSTERLRAHIAFMEYEHSLRRSREVPRWLRAIGRGVLEFLGGVIGRASRKRFHL